MLGQRRIKDNLPAAQKIIIKSQKGNDMAGTVKVTLTKSMIGSTRKIRATLVGLGLTRREKTIIRKDTPEIRGMLRKVEHLVTVEEE